MPHIVYREDDHGLRYVVCAGVSKKRAYRTLERMNTGRPHKQHYATLSYKAGEKEAIMRQHKIQD
jgi:hypothetical protein